MEEVELYVQLHAKRQLPGQYRLLGTVCGWKANIQQVRACIPLLQAKHQHGALYRKRETMEERAVARGLIRCLPGTAQSMVGGVRPTFQGFSESGSCLHETSQASDNVSLQTSDYIHGKDTSASLAVRREVRSSSESDGYYATGYPKDSTQPAPPHEGATTATEVPFTEAGEQAENIGQGRTEPTPTVEVRKFSAPHMEWDATR